MIPGCNNELRKSKYWLETPHHELIIPKVAISNHDTQLKSQLLISPVSSDSISASTVESKDFSSLQAMVSHNPIIGSPLNTWDDLMETIEGIKNQINKIDNKLTRNSMQIQIKFIESLISKLSKYKWRRRKSFKIDDDWRIILQSLSLTIDQFLILEGDNNSRGVVIEDKQIHKTVVDSVELEEQQEQDLIEEMGTLKLEPPEVYKMPFHRKMEIQSVIEEEDQLEDQLSERVIRSPSRQR